MLQGASQYNASKFLQRSFWFALIALLISGTCAANHHPGANRVEDGSIISTGFGPDGRLWRVSAGKKKVYVDHSADFGKSFSAPVLVNVQPQRIKADSENRPAIAADGKGNVYVTYPAEGEQPTAVYASISRNSGESFSIPKPISDHAGEANSLNGTLKLDPSGRAYVVWLDERDRKDWREPGNSIYYAVLDGQWRNEKAASDLCECCRLAVDFDTDGTPVLLARFIYPVRIRDHGLAWRVDGAWTSQRVTFDEWQLEACPDHGPALSIGSDRIHHITWFTEGSAHQGLFYAHSDNGQFTPPISFGNPQRMPGHPVILSQGQHIFLGWKEFDGVNVHIMVKHSQDAGKTWSQAISVASSSKANDNPVLLTNGKRVFLSWYDRKEGYRLIPLN
ncbi:MAG: sialidase family protein [Nitrosospira sp.]